MLEHDFVAAKPIVRDEAHPTLFSFDQKAQDERNKTSVAFLKRASVLLHEFFLARHAVFQFYRWFDLFFGEVGIDLTEERFVLALGGNLVNGALRPEILSYIARKLKVVVDDQRRLPTCICA